MLSHPSVGQFNLCLLLPSTHVLYPYSVTELINIHFGNNSNTSQHILNMHKSFTFVGVELDTQLRLAGMRGDDECCGDGTVNMVAR